MSKPAAETNKTHQKLSKTVKNFQKQSKAVKKNKTNENSSKLNEIVFYVFCFFLIAFTANLGINFDDKISASFAGACFPNGVM